MDGAAAPRSQGGVVVIKQIGRETTDEASSAGSASIRAEESLDAAELVVILRSLEGLCPDGYPLET